MSESHESQSYDEGTLRSRRRLRRKAKLTDGAGRHWVWLIPLFALLLTVVIVWRSLPPDGETITVSFASAEGIKKGQTQVRYKGMNVGDIDSMAFNESLDRVELTLKINETVKPLLREKTQFWVVRPDISTSGVSGITTIVSGPYITFRPGEGKLESSFEGLARPPILQREGTSIEITSDQLYDIEPGDDVYYKQVPVGKVYAYQLHSEKVTLFAQIHAPYNELLRENSVFWEQSGLEMDVGLTGVSVSANPVVSLLNGGLSFATPEKFGKKAGNNARFTLNQDPDEEWQEWTPKIKLPTLIIDQEGESHPRNGLMSSAARNAVSGG